MPSQSLARIDRARAHRLVERALPVVLTVCAVAHLAYYFPRVVDDLFISLRYASNLVHGRGAVYNVGERVEGYSSPPWMFAQAIGIALHAEPVTWTKALAVAAFAGLVVALHRVGREQIRAGAWIAWIAPAMVVANSYVVNWTMLGLETPAHLALLVASGFALERFAATNDDDRAQRRRSGAWAFVFTTAFATVRPESLLHLAAIVVGVVAASRSRAELRARITRLGVVLVPAGVVLAALLVARRSYYGAWVPHTFFVKGTGAGSAFDLHKLDPLNGEGAPIFERLFLAGGAIGLVVAAVARRVAWPLCATLSCAFFCANVDRDWMPSLRHFLPIYVLVGLGWVALVDDALERLRSRRAGRIVAVGLLALACEILPLTALQLAVIDNRYSVAEHDAERGWLRPKSLQLADDAWHALRHREPAHIKAMDGFHMGALTQNFRVLEASAAPIADSWYVGNDIGTVGFYTDVRVFDTAGLFTPAVVQSAAWRHHREVPRSLLERAFEHHPVALELLNTWSPAMVREPDLLAGYEVIERQGDLPIEIAATSLARPSGEEVRRRYRESTARFPQWFYLETLYGESVGAAMDKRMRFVESATADRPELTTTPLTGAGITIAGAVVTRGCALSSIEAHPGDEVELTCAFDVLSKPERDYVLFVHVEGPAGSRFTADHLPSLGTRPTSTWRPGTHVQDTARVAIPPNAKPGTYRVFFGLWHPDVATKSEPLNKLDPARRPIGPTLVVH